MSNILSYSNKTARTGEEDWIAVEPYTDDDIQRIKDYFRETVVPGDVLLLCTDGLYDTLRREQIAAEVTCGRTLDETCRELTKLASLKGSNDNITLICAEIAEDDIHE